MGEGRHEGVWYEGDGDDGGGWWRLAEGGCGSAEGDYRGGGGDEGTRTKVSKLECKLEMQMETLENLWSIY